MKDLRNTAAGLQEAKEALAELGHLAEGVNDFGSLTISTRYTGDTGTVPLKVRLHLGHSLKGAESFKQAMGSNKILQTFGQVFDKMLEDVDIVQLMEDELRAEYTEALADLKTVVDEAPAELPAIERVKRITFDDVLKFINDTMGEEAISVHQLNWLIMNVFRNRGAQTNITVNTLGTLEQYPETWKPICDAIDTTIAANRADSPTPLAVTFQAISDLADRALADEKITTSQLDQIFVDHGVNNRDELRRAPEIWETVYSSLTALYKTAPPVQPDEST